MKPMVRLWRFKDAPACYRKLSPQKGDWLMYIPNELIGDVEAWLVNAAGAYFAQIHLEAGKVLVFGAVL